MTRQVEAVYENGTLQFPDHLIESVDFGRIAVIDGGELPNRGLEPRDEHSRVGQMPWVDNLRHLSRLSLLTRPNQGHSAV